MSELSKILTEANTEKWSLREIENQAAKHGHKLNFTTVGKYFNGSHGKPSAEVLQAFADVFRLDVNELRAAASMPALGSPFVLPAEAAQLTAPEREAITHLVRVMVESKKTTKQTPDKGLKRTGTTPLPSNYYELAAHPAGNSPSMHEHAAGMERGEESQDHPDD